MREDEDNVLSASDLENAFANHIAVNSVDDTLLGGVTDQALVGTVKDTFKGYSNDFRSKCYYGIGLKSKNILEFSSALGSPMSVVEKYGFQEVEYQSLNNLLKNVVKLGEKLQEYISNGDNEFNGDYFKTLYLKREEMLDGLLLMYFNAVNEEKRKSKPENIDKLQRKMIKDEVIQLKDIFDKGFRSNTVDRTELPEGFIKDIIDELTKKCPFIHGILSSLVVDEFAAGTNTAKTVDYKMKQAILSLGLLMSVRNQKWMNDLSLSFSLAAVSYGAVDKFITFLNNLGLSTSWKTL